MLTGSFHRHFYFQEGMWENKNVYGKFPDISIDIFIFRKECGKIKMSWEGSMDIFIFRKECGKIKMSMENFH
jgi:hypothetical protein